MSLNVKENYNSAVVEINEKLVGGPLASQVDHLLHNLLDKGIKNIIVDLKGVNYMNSTGMGILISGLTSMRKSGGDLKLANLNSKIEGILQITKLNQIFEQYDSVASAEKSYK